MRHGSLFSGIGGFDLAAEWMGWENKFHCEWEEFPRKVLKNYWPDAISYGDIKTTDFTIWRGTIDILTGGFPCQPFSVAGYRKGENDNRYLWPEMLRAIREIKPTYIIAENVSGLVTMEDGKTLEGILSDMEAEGYKVEPCLIEASGVGSWHRRERIWILAYTVNSSNIAIKEQKGEKKTIQRKRKQKRFAREFTGTDNTFYTNDRIFRNKGFIKKEIPELKGFQGSEKFGRVAILGERSDISTPVLCRNYDGIPNGMDRVKAFGNAIVPQVAYQIFKAIEQYENL